MNRTSQEQAELIAQITKDDTKLTELYENHRWLFIACLNLGRSWAWIVTQKKWWTLILLLEIKKAKLRFGNWRLKRLIEREIKRLHKAAKSR